MRSSRRGWACSPPPRGSSTCARCLLSLDGEDTATLYLQDTKQGVYRFSTAVSAASVKEYLESQDGGNADFARSLGEGYTSLSPYTLVFDSVSARRELSAANALSDYPSEELLRRAEFNPHTKDRYVESSGTEVVIEGQRKLYLHPDGTLLLQRWERRRTAPSLPSPRRTPRTSPAPSSVPPHAV